MKVGILSPWVSAVLPDGLLSMGMPSLCITALKTVPEHITGLGSILAVGTESIGGSDVRRSVKATRAAV